MEPPPHSVSLPPASSRLPGDPVLRHRTNLTNQPKPCLTPWPCSSIWCRLPTSMKSTSHTTVGVRSLSSPNRDGPDSSSAATQHVDEFWHVFNFSAVRVTRRSELLRRCLFCFSPLIFCFGLSRIGRTVLVTVLVHPCLESCGGFKPHCCWGHVIENLGSFGLCSCADQVQNSS